MNLQYRPVRRKNAIPISSLLIDVYASFLTLVSDGNAMTQAEKFLTPFCSRAMLICLNHLVRKADVAVVVLRVLFFVEHEVAPYSVSLNLYCLKLFLRAVDADQLIRYLRHN